MISSRLQSYFQDYQAYHSTRGNQLTHVFGIPMIVLSLLGLAGQIDLGLGVPHTLLRLDGGVVMLSLAALFYLGLDWRISVPFLFVLSGMYFLGRAVPVLGLWSCLIIGWILQGVGHGYFEKRSPAFTKNIAHLLIGPLWIFSKLLGLDSVGRIAGE